MPEVLIAADGRNQCWLPASPRAVGAALAGLWEVGGVLPAPSSGQGRLASRGSSQPTLTAPAGC